MSDQPKPRIGDTIDTPLDWDARITQPKPKGEWTVEKVERTNRECWRLSGCSYVTFIKDDAEMLATYINAALAAAHRAAEVEINEGVAARDINHLSRISELEAQLAAERERRERAEEWSATLAKLADDNTVSYNATCDQLRDQLAAELEKVQELVEALHVLYTSKDQELRKQVYHAELAKVEGYPLPDGRTK